MSETGCHPLPIGKPASSTCNFQTSFSLFNAKEKGMKDY